MIYDENEDLGDHRSAMIRFASELALGRPIRGASRQRAKLAARLRRGARDRGRGSDVREYAVINIGHPDVVPIDGAGRAHPPGARRARRTSCESIDLPARMTPSKRPVARRGSATLLGVEPRVVARRRRPPRLRARPRAARGRTSGVWMSGRRCARPAALRRLDRATRRFRISRRGRGSSRAHPRSRHRRQPRRPQHRAGVSRSALAVRRWRGDAIVLLHSVFSNAQHARTAGCSTPSRGGREPEGLLHRQRIQAHAREDGVLRRRSASRCSCRRAARRDVHALYRAAAGLRGRPASRTPASTRTVPAPHRARAEPADRPRLSRRRVAARISGTPNGGTSPTTFARAPRASAFASTSRSIRATASTSAAGRRFSTAARASSAPRPAATTSSSTIAHATRGQRVVRAEHPTPSFDEIRDRFFARLPRRRCRCGS